MCLLKGLDIIAVTDHNSVRNVEAVVNLAQRKGLVVVPGMEVQTKRKFMYYATSTLWITVTIFKLSGKILFLK